MAAAPIFISYRRADAAGSARALFLMLRYWFGEDQVFFDQADLQPGDVFPERLRAAIAASRITLAVIGPSWLSEVNRRARERPADVDVVREELKLSLQLHAQAPEARWVVPVLMECEAMPQQAELDTALRADLGSLWQHNARALGGDQQRWDHAVRGLLIQLQELAALMPVPQATDAHRIEQARRQVSDALAPGVMQPLRGRWGPDPLAGLRLDDDLTAVAAKLGQAIDRALPDWRKRSLDTDGLLEVKTACRDIAAAIYALAIDGAAARAWLEEVRAAVPLQSVGALAFAHAVVHGKRASIAVSSDPSVAFEPEGALDFGEPDPGGTDRRRAMAHERMWRDTYTDPRRPYPHPGQPLKGEELADLKARLAARRLIEERDFILTERQQATGDTMSDLAQIAAELGMVAIPRTGIDRGLLRVEERGFNAMIAEVLKRVEKIK